MERNLSIYGHMDTSRTFFFLFSRKKKFKDDNRRQQRETDTVRFVGRKNVPGARAASIKHKTPDPGCTRHAAGPGGKRECDAVGRARARTQFRIQVVLHLARRWLKHGSWDGAWGRISTGSTVLAKERTGPTAVRVRGKAKGREKEGAARVFGSLVSPLLEQGCLRACASRGRPGSDLPNGSGGRGGIDMVLGEGRTDRPAQAPRPRVCFTGGAR